MTRRPTFAECHEYASREAGPSSAPVVNEITAILRTLVHGSDPRTCRVLKSGAVVPIGSVGEEDEP